MMYLRSSPIDECTPKRIKCGYVIYWHNIAAHVVWIALSSRRREGLRRQANWLLQKMKQLQMFSVVSNMTQMDFWGFRSISLAMDMRYFRHVPPKIDPTTCLMSSKSFINRCSWFPETRFSHSNVTMNMPLTDENCRFWTFSKICDYVSQHVWMPRIASHTDHMRKTWPYQPIQLIKTSCTAITNKTRNPVLRLKSHRRAHGTCQAGSTTERRTGIIRSEGLRPSTPAMHTAFELRRHLVKKGETWGDGRHILNTILLVCVEFSAQSWYARIMCWQ